jgi:hypothetical protein
MGKQGLPPLARGSIQRDPRMHICKTRPQTVEPANNSMRSVVILEIQSALNDWKNGRRGLLHHNP